jgi:hypothetical protein
MEFDPSDLKRSNVIQLKFNKINKQLKRWHKGEITDTEFVFLIKSQIPNFSRNLSEKQILFIFGNEKMTEERIRSFIINEVDICSKPPCEKRAKKKLLFSDEVKKIGSAELSIEPIIMNKNGNIKISSVFLLCVIIILVLFMILKIAKKTNDVCGENFDVTVI